MSKSFIVRRGHSVLTDTKRHVAPGGIVEDHELSPAMLKDLLDNGFLRHRNADDDEDETIAPKMGGGEIPKDGKANQIGKWDFDPATLANKSLKQLNTMIVERDTAVQPFDTVEEARAFLSQHFQKPS